MRNTLLFITVLMLVLSGLLYSQSEGKKVGTVKQVNKKTREIVVGSSSAAKDIKMGDLLYVRVEGKVVRLRATFPMQTVAKCRAEGKNKALWGHIARGMDVYRYQSGMDQDHEVKISKQYKIGDRGPAGGWVFYDKGNYDSGWRYLEAAPEDQGRTKWGCYGKKVGGALNTTIGTGKANTEAILRNCPEETQPKVFLSERRFNAARLAASYRGGGKSDWYLPSKDELHEIYKNLARKGIGNFGNIPFVGGEFYWSSSEVNAFQVWTHGFDYLGHQNDGYKNGFFRVRAIRTF